MTMLKIPTTKGEIEVPVHYEDGCKNLCVTMTNFGSFEITHIHSGRKLYGNFERASSAVCEMLKIELSLRDIGIDEKLPMNLLTQRIINSDKIINRLSDMSVMSYIKFCSGLSNIVDEFPWETYEESPFGRAEELKKELISS